jgi:hypothetical protein
MAYPAPTNDIDRRLAAVEAMLLGAADGGPMMLIDRSRCPTIIQALGGGYRYAKTRDGRRKPSPDKNEFSHIMDALQYACLAFHGGLTTMVANRMRRKPQAQVQSVSPAGWT